MAVFSKSVFAGLLCSFFLRVPFTIVSFSISTIRLSPVCLFTLFLTVFLSGHFTSCFSLYFRRRFHWSFLAVFRKRVFIDHFCSFSSVFFFPAVFPQNFSLIVFRSFSTKGFCLLFLAVFPWSIFTGCFCGISTKRFSQRFLRAFLLLVSCSISSVLTCLFKSISSVLLNWLFVAVFLQNVFTDFLLQYFRGAFSLVVSCSISAKRFRWLFLAVFLPSFFFVVSCSMSSEHFHCLFLAVFPQSVFTGELQFFFRVCLLIVSRSISAKRFHWLCLAVFPQSVFTGEICGLSSRCLYWLFLEVQMYFREALSLVVSQVFTQNVFTGCVLQYFLGASLLVRFAVFPQSAFTNCF